MANKCPRNNERGTWYFEWFCNDKTDNIRKHSPRYVYCQHCPNYKANKGKGKDDEMEMLC